MTQTAESPKVCNQCKQACPDARPYGPGRSLICASCAYDTTPALRAIASKYEREEIEAELESKLTVLRAAFPDATIIRLDPKMIAALLTSPALREALTPNPECDCPVCSNSRVTH